MKLYLIGSLRNPQIPEIGNRLRAEGFDVFADWFAAGEIADDRWRDYEKARGHSYMEALNGLAADHVFQFDRTHLHRADLGVLVLPAGRSGFMEAGYLLGRGRPVYILLDDHERWDVMMKFATGVYTDLEDLIEGLHIPKPRYEPFCHYKWGPCPDR